MHKNFVSREEDILEGVVYLAQYDLIIKDYVIWLDSESQKVIIPCQELELDDIKCNLNGYIGKKIKFKIIDYDDKRRISIGSCKKICQQKRNHLIEEMKSGKTFKGIISRLVYFGAYLNIDDTPVMIRNSDFACDYTKISDIYQEGDLMAVKLLKVAHNGKIYVQAAKKYESGSKINIEDFKPHTVVQGLVRNVKSWACFVNIAPNLDAICPVPTYFKIKEGMRVAFRINQVRIEDRRVRGKIIKVID